LTGLAGRRSHNAAIETGSPAAGTPPLERRLQAGGPPPGGRTKG